VLNALFKFVAIALTNWEFHRTHTSYDSSIIAKLFLFRFVNSYAPLLLIAFAAKSMSQLSSHLAAQLITGALVNDFIEIAQPWALKRWGARGSHSTDATHGSGVATTAGNKGSKRQRAEDIRMAKEVEDAVAASVLTPAAAGARASSSSLSAAGPAASSSSSSSSESGNNPLDDALAALGMGDAPLRYVGSQVAVELAMVEYDTLQSAEDHLELVIQYGLLTMFVPAFPLAGLVGLLTNVLENFIDRWKFCHLTRRAMPTVSVGIGSWLTVLEFMSVIAVITNVGLLGVTDPTRLAATNDAFFCGDGGAGSDHFPCRPHDFLWFVVLLEHFVIALKVLLMVAIPDDTAEVVADRHRQLFFLRREEGVYEQQATPFAVAHVAGDSDDDEPRAKHFDSVARGRLTNARRRTAAGKKKRMGTLRLENKGRAKGGSTSKRASKHRRAQSGSGRATSKQHSNTINSSSRDRGPAGRAGAKNHD
jgi:hypothetical protein